MAFVQFTTSVQLYSTFYLERASKKYKSKIVLIFDEIESFAHELSSAEHWKSGNDYIEFWQTVRATQQERPGLFVYVLCGVNPTPLERHTIGSHSNPIFSGLNPMYLSPFSQLQTKEMVQTIGEYMGLTFDEEIFSRLENAYGGHPFLIRMVCSKLHEKTLHHGRPHHIETKVYLEMTEEIEDKLFPNIKQILEKLETDYPTEYILLEDIASGKQDIKQNIMQDHDEILHLLSYNIIKKDADNKYFLTIKAMEKYLQKPTSLSRNKASTTEKEQGSTPNEKDIVVEVVKEAFKAMNKKPGDTYNFGNVTGSIINIDSTLEQVTQIIGSANIEDSAKKQIIELIEQLKTELQKVSSDNKEEAEALADTAKALLDASTKESPNKATVKITAAGLTKAAENLASVTPKVLVIASSIVKTVFQLIGIPLP